MKEQKTAAMAFRNGCVLASPSATVAKSALASEDSSVGASGREVFAITCWARQGFPTEEEAATFYAGASRVLALAGRTRLSGCRLFVGPISVVCGRTCNSARSSCGQRLALPAVARDSLPVFRARALERRPRRVGPDSGGPGSWALFGGRMLARFGAPKMEQPGRLRTSRFAGWQPVSSVQRVRIT